MASIRIPYLWLIFIGIVLLATHHVPVGILFLCLGILPPVLSRIADFLWGE
jgi:hypothetical protein